MKTMSSLSFGRYLKNARVDRGVSLQQISTHTRIAIDNLLSIEREDHARLPAEVFVRGFIRSYAAAVGADADQAVGLYMASRHVFHEKARAEADLQKSTLHYWPRFFVWLVLLLAYMALTMAAASLFQGKQVAPEEDQSRAAKKDPPPAALAVPAKAKPQAAAAPAAVPEKLLLKVVTVEKTWLKVIVDQQRAREYNLNPGDRLELEALAQFNLLIGNAAGVQLNLNSSDLPIPGKPGQVVTLKLP